MHQWSMIYMLDADLSLISSNWWVWMLALLTKSQAKGEPYPISVIRVSS